jgi:cytochrome c-type biogenesis protein CcmE
MNRKGSIALGTIVSIFVATLAVSGMVIAFLSNASPYVTIAEAKTSLGDDLHVTGGLVPGSLKNDHKVREVRFTLKDEGGETLPVIYTGESIANMEEATKIVAIGKYEEGTFKAHKLLVKCPSKYEAEKKGSS